MHKIRTLDDFETHRQAALELSEYGGAAVKPLVLFLARADEHAYGRRWAWEIIKHIGRHAVADLVFLLRTGDGDMRRTAASELGRIGGDAAGALDALENALWDREPRVRSMAVFALGSLGAVGAPALFGLLYNGDPELQQAAIEALRVSQME